MTLLFRFEFWRGEMRGRSDHQVSQGNLSVAGWAYTTTVKSGKGDSVDLPFQ
jgi:hypothetical protein